MPVDTNPVTTGASPRYISKHLSHKSGVSFLLYKNFPNHLVSTPSTYLVNTHPLSFLLYLIIILKSNNDCVRASRRRRRRREGPSSFMVRTDLDLG